MANPFAPDLPPDPPAKRDRDALLEFEPERKRTRLDWIRPAPVEPPKEPLVRPTDPVIHLPDLAEPPEDLRRSQSAWHQDHAGRSSARRSIKMNPMFGFALGVFGIVTAAGAYYQMFGWVRSRPPVQQTEAPRPAEPVAPVPVAATAPTTGRLTITTDPSGASVSVDGKASGVTPLTLTDVVAGSHQVVISSGTSSVTRAVDVPAGATATVMATLAPPAPPAPVVGWATFESPVDLRIIENGRLIGTTRASRLALAPGAHELELVSDALNVRQTVTVSIGAGRTTRAPVALPMGTVSINALPWAEVWVGGESVGMTPLANLAVPVGPHEILWKHPTLGERRQTVIVKAGSPVRVGVDLNK